MDKKKATLLMIINMAIFGVTFSLTKPLLAVMGVFNFISVRFMIGGLVLCIALMLTGRLKLDRASLRGGVLTGVIMFFVFIFHTYGLKYTSVANNAFIVGGSVIFVPIILRFARGIVQRRIVWISCLIAVAGLAFVTLDGQSMSLNFGDGLTLIGTVLLAYYVIKVEDCVEEGDPMTIASIHMVVIGLLSSVASFIVETPTLSFSREHWIAMLILGIACTSIAFAINNLVQSVLPASQIGLLYTLEPIFGAIFGWVILSEAFGINVVIGAMLIALSVKLPDLNLGQRISVQNTARIVKEKA